MTLRSEQAKIHDPSHSHLYSDLQVMRSAAGYYIGTAFVIDGESEPGTRDSEYFPTREAAETALKSGQFTRRLNP